MSTLFGGDNSDSDGDIKINSDYAKDYNNWRQKEELNKLKTKYEEVTTDDSSSSDDEDDENIENPQFDREFYKTLACLKKKDPCIYDKDVKFFNNIDTSGTTEHAVSEDKREKKLKKKKSVFLRDFESKMVMGENGQFSSSEDEDNAKKNTKVKTYMEEQQEMKDSFKHTLKEKSEDTDEDIDFLKEKQRTENDKQEEDKSYKKWLKGQTSEIDLTEQEELKPLRDFWTDPNLDTNEKFLRDYILNNKYVNKESSDVELDYDQIVHDSDKDLSEDEENIEKQEEFEHKYNFRFEEPDQEFIKRYPRTMENSMRRKDTRRGQKRAEIRERKEKEKQQKREELKQLKALKRKEIEEKIEKLKEITGNDDMRFNGVDFDADFDPNEHDRKMKELFNEVYYAGAEDDMKPEFPDIDEELGIENTWDNYDPTNADEIDTEDAPHEEPHCDDTDFNMDADYDGSQNLQSELIESTRKRKKRNSKFAMLIAKKKPKFDPKQFPSYEEYFDQYYSLDYEDMIGDLPCRFKYRKVMPNDYGLSVEEILIADDKELNKWCSLKRALQHKPEHVEMQEVQSFKQKATNEMYKQKILKSLYKSENQEDRNASANEQTINNSTENKKRRRKKKTKTNFNADSTITNTVSKKRIAETTDDSMQNNFHNIKNDEEQDKTTQEKNIINKNNENKRKNKLRVDSDGPRPKKIKMDDIKEESSQVKMDNKTIEDNKKIASVDKTAVIQEKRNKTKEKRKLKLKKIKSGNHKSNSVNANPLMSLNAERLKTYGINAKKFKNKLKYGKKKF